LSNDRLKPEFKPKFRFSMKRYRNKNRKQEHTDIETKKFRSLVLRARCLRLGEGVGDRERLRRTERQRETERE
jgi:hypothetical protein